jgi:hypothetical protein
MIKNGIKFNYQTKHLNQETVILLLDGVQHVGRVNARLDDHLDLPVRFDHSNRWTHIVEFDGI